MNKERDILQKIIDLQQKMKAKPEEGKKEEPKKEEPTFKYTPPETNKPKS